MEINKIKNENINEEREINSYNSPNVIEVTSYSNTNPEINCETNNIQTERFTINRPKYPIYCNISNIQTEYFSIIQKLICCLCKGILYYPLQDECEHIFCEKCYKIFCPNPPFKCPISDKYILQPLELNGLKLILNDLNIFCPNECDWNGKYIDLIEHKKICPNEFIKCPFHKCPYEIIRKNFENHKKNCIFRYEECSYCSEIMQVYLLDEHYKICSKYPINCLLKCGKKIIRSKMDYHIKNECDNYELNCGFYKYGCNEICKRKNMENHLKEEVAYHLSLFVSKIDKYIPNLNEYNNDYDYLNKKRKNDIIYIVDEENGNDKN